MKPEEGIVATVDTTQGTAPSAKVARKHRLIREKPLLVLALAILLFLTLFPYYFMIISSFKHYQQIVSNFWFPSLPAHLDNYTSAWKSIKNNIFNTLGIAAITVVGSLLFSSLSAYVFARHNFYGKEVLYFMVISLMMIPGILTLLPRFMLIETLS